MGEVVSKLSGPLDKRHVAQLEAPTGVEAKGPRQSDAP
jgi:hypothetical protein